jgi:hypothetical protein
MTSTETTIIITAAVLWFAQGWYLNERLKAVHEKLDRTINAFEGLRDYLYEIDPQFDDEREIAIEIGEGGMFAQYDEIKLIKQKQANGQRTLNSSFLQS